MRWHLSWRADPRALPLADRHYSRQTPGSAQFVPPGRCLVLLTERADALWVTSWPLPEYVKHAWPGAWTCSLFRNESEHLSSELIREALAATRHAWGDPPPHGMVSFVDEAEVRPKRDPGYCFLAAGFERVGRTVERGLVVLQHPPGRRRWDGATWPAPEAPLGWQDSLLEA